MTVLQRAKPIRSWLLSTEDAAKALCVTPAAIRALSDEGFIAPAARNGFFRLGCLMDGYAEAVRVGRLTPPHARSAPPVGLQWIETA